MQTGTINLLVNRSLLDAFTDIANKRKVPPEQIEKEALVTYLRVIGYYEPTENYEERRYVKIKKDAVVINQQLEGLKKKSNKHGTRYEI